MPVSGRIIGYGGFQGGAERQSDVARKSGCSGQDLKFPQKNFTVKKYPYMHGYYVASFPRFNGTGSVYVCIRKSTE